VIKYIQILGERYSGTNYLAALIRANIPSAEITKSFGFKHWFIKDHQPRSAPNNTTDLECVRSLDHSDDTLFLVILRNPFDWLRSLARFPYHAPNHVGLTFSNFIRTPWISYERNQANSDWAISDDGIYFIEKAENILVLRTKKIQHWINLRQRVKHIAFINYENLYKNPSALVDIADNFNIPVTNRPLIDEPRYLTGGAVKNELFVPKKYEPILKHDLEFIESTLDWDVEESVNYKFSDYLNKVE
jgi:hypothetical protein